MTTLNLHGPGGIRTRNPSKRAATDPCLGPVACPGILFGGGGSTNSVEGQRVERTGIWGRLTPSQGFWRQLWFGTRNFISYSKIFLIFGTLRLFMMTTNLFFIANVKQLQTGGSFRVLLPFFRISWGVGVLNSVIFNSFHNRVEFGTILEGFRNLGGFEPPTSPTRYATALDRAITEISWWLSFVVVTKLSLYFTN